MLIAETMFLACDRFRDVSQFRKHIQVKMKYVLQKANLVYPVRLKPNPQLAISNLTMKYFNFYFIFFWRKLTSLIRVDH